MTARAKASESRLIGKRQPRISGADKVTGRAKYTFDINRPGMLYARIFRSEIPHGMIEAIDLSEAEALPGVKAVVPLIEAGKYLRYQGQEIAAVAAKTDDIAKDALRIIRYDYQALPHVVEVEEAMGEYAPQIRNDWRRNQSKPDIREEGNLTAGFAQAAVEVEATYHAPVQTHVCLETHGHVVEWEGDNLTVWASTQAVFGTRADFARHFDLPEGNVRVITEHMGGGFGSKFSPGIEGIAAAELARKAGKPVKLMLTRRDEHLVSGNRPSMTQHVRAGATKNGRLIAYKVRGYGTGGISGGAGFQAPYIYSVPNFRTEKFNVSINAGNARAMRAPGHPQGAFAMDSLMDELAEKLSMDPLEFRRINDANEVRRAQYALGSQEIGWWRRNKAHGLGKGVRKRGMGMGSCLWGGGGGQGTQARVTIHADGTVQAVTGTQDLGTGIRTVIAIIVAEEFGLQPQDIKVKIGDSAYGLTSGGSGGSQTIGSVAPVIKTAAEAAKTRLFERIAPSLGANPKFLFSTQSEYQNSDLLWNFNPRTLFFDNKIQLSENVRVSMRKDSCEWHIHDLDGEQLYSVVKDGNTLNVYQLANLCAKHGQIHIESNRNKSISWEQATRQLGLDTISEEGYWDEQLRQNGVAGTQFADVEVDIETGNVKVIKIVAIQDCGLAINRLTTESQINGGVIMGLGYALLEERIMDSETGRMINPNLEDYKVAGPMEIPEIKPIVFDTHRKITGIGEPPTIPTAGAIANAVYNAAAVRIRELPITPDKVLRALAEKGTF